LRGRGKKGAATIMGGAGFALVKREDHNPWGI